MSDLEGFSPNEQTEGIDAAALEQMRENMKKASAQMARDQKQEAKQKKEEDNLYEVLVAFVKKLGPNNNLVKLISACIAHNITAELILGVIALNFSTIQKLLGVKIVEKSQAILTESQSQALVNPKISDSDLPLHVRINIDAWLKAINSIAFLNPVRNAKTLANKQDHKRACGAFHNLISYIAQDYLEREKINFNPNNVINFVNVFSDNLLQRLQMHNENTKELNDGAS